MYKKVFPALLVGLIAVPTIGAIRNDAPSPEADATDITQVEPGSTAPSASTDPVDEGASVTAEPTSTHHGRRSVLRTAAVSALSTAIASTDGVAPAGVRSIPPAVTVESGEPAPIPETPDTEAPEAPATETPEAPAALSPQAPATEAPQAPVTEPSATDTPATETPQTPATETPAEIVLDTKGPEVTVKPESVGTNGVYSNVSVKLHDPSKVDKVTINGVEKDLDNNEWSDVNGIRPGVFGAVEGNNVLVAYDAVGNTTTINFELDTVAPTAAVKNDMSDGASGVYRKVSYKLADAGEGQIDYVTVNGVKKDLTNNKWSDVNGIVPGVFGAVEGKNTLVVFDTAGNSSSYTFVLDTKGPEVTVKPESVGTNGVYSNVSVKLHDPSKVDKVTINGVEKDLDNNEWSDVNGIRPGVFGAVEGNNVLVAYDAVGNTTTINFELDTVAPTAAVKNDMSDGASGVYRKVSYKLADAGEGQIDYVTVNGVKKDLTNNKWSDVNGIVPGVFGAVEGKNTLVVFDTAGNSSSYTFVLDTKGPEVTVKPESVGTNGVYSNVSVKLHDPSKVDKVTINGVEKDLDNNEWSDVNGIRPGVFGAVEGNNVLVAYDAVGNTTTINFELDTVAPTAAVKNDMSDGASGVYRKVSYKLADAGEGQIDYVTVNGVKKDLTNNKWSDVNGIVPGVFGAVEGKNTLVVFDTAGNSSSYTFVLDTKGPEVTVKPESVGTNGVYSNVSVKLHDPSKVDKVTINGVEKDLDNNEWSDVNGIRPGVFGAVEGNNVLVAYDAVGNTTTINFELNTVAPTPVVVTDAAVIVPDVIAPEVIVPEATVPEATVPEATAPEATVPEATAPEATVPEATAPEATVPEATVPEVTAPEASDS